MEIDPMEAVEKADNQPDRSKYLNTVIAVTVALLASFMGVCKVKDDNIVQSMQQMQANKLDHWAYYQARNIREEVAKATLVQLRLAAAGITAEQQVRYQAAIETYEKIASEQRQKKEELKFQAEQDQKDYDAANFRDDQFDLSDALIAIAISMLAITALTRQWWLYFISLVPSALGIMMGLAGFCGWQIHPDVLIRFLS